MSPKPGRISLVEEVTQTLMERVSSGEYQATERMPTEQEISSELNVSRSCVREAMRSLEILNVVEVRHGTGTFVKSRQPDFLIDPKRFSHTINRETLMDRSELRSIVEVESAGLAAQRATPEEIQTLSDDVAALAVGVSEHRRPDEDMGFHLNVARATHNPSIVEISRWIVAFYEIDPLIPDTRDISAHRAVYEAIRDRDADGARLAMQIHLQEVESRFRALAAQDDN